MDNIIKKDNKTDEKVFRLRVSGLDSFNTKIDAILGSFASRQDELTKVLNPLYETQAKLFKDNFPNFSEALAPVFKESFKFDTSSVIRNMMDDKMGLQGLNKTLEKMSDQWMKGVRPSIQQFLHNLYDEPFREFLKQINEISAKHRAKVFHYTVNAAYEARWFPSVIWEEDCSLLEDCYNILQHTRKSKSRQTKIDKAVFSFYTKTRIEAMRKAWIHCDLPPYIQMFTHFRQRLCEKDSVFRHFSIEYNWVRLINQPEIPQRKDMMALNKTGYWMVKELLRWDTQH